MTARIACIPRAPPASLKRRRDGAASRSASTLPRRRARRSSARAGLLARRSRSAAAPFAPNAFLRIGAGRHGHGHRSSTSRWARAS